MRKFLLLIFICCAMSGLRAVAQECAGFNLKEGSVFETNNFDAKGKPMGKIIYKIVKVAKDGAYDVYTIDMESINTKGKSDLKNTYQMKCNGNVLLLDASSLISP